MGATQASRYSSELVPAAPENRSHEAAIERTARIAGAYERAHRQGKASYFLQRAVEIFLGSVALLVTWPIMLVVAIIVKRDTPGPVIFHQQRVGKGGKPFTFHKFRTLYADAKQRWPEMYRYQFTPEEVERYQVKRATDPRVTPAGRWLRKSTLDELPNFWNLVKGDIALVGPRPEIPDMLQYYTDEQLIKFAVRPGITGLAQTHGRGNLAFQQTNAWDVEYVRTRSLWNDVRIVFRTIRLLTDGSF